jgi:hypothetical protein
MNPALQRRYPNPYTLPPWTFLLPSLKYSIHLLTGEI